MQEQSWVTYQLLLFSQLLLFTSRWNTNIWSWIPKHDKAWVRDPASSNSINAEGDLSKAEVSRAPNSLYSSTESLSNSSTSWEVTNHWRNIEKLSQKQYPRTCIASGCMPIPGTCNRKLTESSSVIVWNPCFGKSKTQTDSTRIFWYIQCVPACPCVLVTVLLICSYTGRIAVIRATKTIVGAKWLRN